MINLGTIYTRVCRWNEARYERKYSEPLSIELLKEEIEEYLDATNPVDRTDALCDTIYVAMGILWKINVDNETLEYNAEESHKQIAALLDTNTLEPIYFAYAIVFKLENDGDYPVALAAQNIITACMTQLAYMGYSNSESLEALYIVCDSNDSKSVKKTESHIKANDGDKGVYFQPPEPRLTALLKRMEVRNNGN